MCRIADTRNTFLAMEILAFGELKQDLHRARLSRERFARARAAVDEIEAGTEELRVSASWSSRYNSVTQQRRRAFYTTPLFHKISPLVKDYRATIKQASTSDKPRDQQ
jgi:hypothetical protein